MSTDTPTDSHDIETASTLTCGHCGSAEDDIDALIEHVLACDENDHAQSR